MTKVLEVTTAEDVTGHTNSIAITAPDRVTFVKGTCPEESKWWLNTLAAFPKSKGRHKRNATFPGAQATTILQSTNSDAANVNATTRNRHNSYHKDILTSTQSTGVLASTTVSTSSSTTTTSSSAAATTANAAAMASKQEKKSSSGIKSNGSSKLWSHNDVVVTTKPTITTSKNAAGIKNNHNVGLRNVAAVNNNNVDDDDDDDENEEDDADEEDDGVETGEDDEEDECDEEEESGNSTGEECNTKKKCSMAGTSVHDENNRNAVNEIKNRGKLQFFSKIYEILTYFQMI
ncbi:protein outspread-like [Lucilia sericata]|uniref:protein outspread-like n=1 Tax=Lucilia sericata TaxID=13632 RepID=UPI0018A84CC9|nr:protein outspread-like [Lucilia sericata]